MTNRSQNTRGIEITDHQQPSPEGNGMMDSLVFHINDSIFSDVYEITRLKRFTGIRYYATNESLIIDDLRVRPEI
jgi:hypothetical protein